MIAEIGTERSGFNAQRLVRRGNRVRSETSDWKASRIPRTTSLLLGLALAIGFAQAAINSQSAGEWDLGEEPGPKLTEQVHWVDRVQEEGLGKLIGVVVERDKADREVMSRVATKRVKLRDRRRTMSELVAEVSSAIGAPIEFDKQLVAEGIPDARVTVLSSSELALDAIARGASRQLGRSVDWQVGGGKIWLVPGERVAERILARGSDIIEAFPEYVPRRAGNFVLLEVDREKANSSSAGLRDRVDSAEYYLEFRDVPAEEALEYFSESLECDVVLSEATKSLIDPLTATVSLEGDELTASAALDLLLKALPVSNLEWRIQLGAIVIHVRGEKVLPLESSFYLIDLSDCAREYQE